MAARLEATNWSFLTEDIGPLIDDTRTGAEHLKAVVSDLKSLSRSTDSVEQLSVDECARRCRSWPTTSNMVSNWNATSMLPARFSSSEIRSFQMLTNLLHNSVQIFDGHPGAITITTRNEEHGVSITIEDSGPGVAENFIARIFTPFFTTRSPGFGTGLGLSIVRRIARDHIGEVTYDRSPKLGGARFLIRMRGAHRMNDRPIVLVVDDEEPIRGASSDSSRRARGRHATRHREKRRYASSPPRTSR